jgi:hypothetical protein
VLAGAVSIAGLAWLRAAPGDEVVPPDVATFVALLEAGRAPMPDAEPALDRASVAPFDAAALDVLVVVQESWSVQRALVPGAMPRLEARRVAAPDRWVDFERAHTVSTSTDLVLEAVLTGVSPAAPAAARNRAPLLWAWADAAGHDTILVTPQSLDWAGLSEVLDLDALDVRWSRESVEAPPHNDLGADEMLGADTLAAAILGWPADRRLVAFYLSNALHTPFQDRSARLAAPPIRGGRYERALGVADAALDRILAALEVSGRLERTLVVVLGDHGVTIDRRHRLPRLYGFYEAFVAVPLMVRVPEALAHRRPEAAWSLAANRARQVDTLDVLPTVIDALGGSAADLEGRSLLAPLPSRHTTVAVNANDRRRWDHEGFAVIHGPWRFLYTDIEGAALYHVGADPTQRVDLCEVAPAWVRKIVLDEIDASPVLRQRIDPAR